MMDSESAIAEKQAFFEERGLIMKKNFGGRGTF
jgi:hypothetical protein